MSVIKEFKKGVKYTLTKNFDSSEFDCKCKNETCNKTYIDLEHVAKLQELRDRWGSIKITSAYRCEKHNKAVGGATNSQHKKGTATDIQVLSLAPLAVYAELESKWIGGMGVYNTFLHIDSRNYIARWNFSKKKHK